MYTTANAGAQLLERVKTYVVDPVLAVIFTLGLLLFFVGIVEFLWNMKEGKPSQEGKNHMIYGLIGMLIMASVYGIINVIVNTLGLQGAADVSRIQNINTGINLFGN